MTDATLKKHIKLCGDLKTQIDELTNLFNIEKEHVTAGLCERITNEFTGNGYTVKQSVFEQNRFNSKAFKDKHPALFKEFTTVTHVNRFTIKSI